MLLRVSLLWIFGLVTIIPFAVYRLLFSVQRDEYTFLISVTLFWIFGFWGAVGPIITVIKVRRVFKSLETSHSGDDIKKVLDTLESRDLAIALIASENHLPKFIVRLAFNRLVERMANAARGARMR